LKALTLTLLAHTHFIAMGELHEFMLRLGLERFEKVTLLSSLALFSRAADADNITVTSMIDGRIK